MHLAYRIGRLPRAFALPALLALFPASGFAQDIQINELRIDQPGEDTDEYVELAGAPGTSLEGYTYLVIGDGAGGSGTIEAVVPLDGQAIPASGFFVAAEGTFTLGTADFTTNLNFENSDNVTHLLVTGFTGADGDDLDTDDDGALDATPWDAVADVVSVIGTGTPGGDAEHYYAAELGGEAVGPDGTFVPGHVYRASDTGTWQIGAFDPAGGNDTPGAENPGAGGGADFVALLGGGSEEAPVPTPASGTVSFDLTGTELIVTGTFEGLTGDYTASHLHLGITGRSGPVTIPLDPTIGGDGRSGTFEAASNTFTLDEAQMTALRERRLYVNVHSTEHPAGEIRGQVLPASDALFESRLAGGAEVPHVVTRASGGLALELRGDSLVVTGSFSGLVGDYTASHLHLGMAGENGPVTIPLNPTLEEGSRGGDYEAANNAFELDEAQRAALEGRGLYANVHSTAHPPGEIRGQVLPMSDIYLQGLLLAENEVPTTLSGGIGGLEVELDGGQLVLSGTFRDLTSAYTASHIHVGEAGVPGAVVIPLAPTIDAGDLSGAFEPANNTFALTDEQVETLLAEGYYVNVHTTQNPPGELRAQLLLAPNNAPDSTAITAPEDGATITVEGDPSQTVTASWAAAADPDGDRVVYVWQASMLEDFSAIILQMNAGADTSLSLTFGALDSLLAEAGVAVGDSLAGFHRVLASDGSVFAPSEAFAFTLTRGMVVGTEDEPTLPAAFALRGNYPNPFGAATTIRYDLPAEAEVRLEVFDLLGRRVLETAPERVAAGAGRTLAVRAALPAGTYVYRLTAEMASQTATVEGRMTVVR